MRNHSNRESNKPETPTFSHSCSDKAGMIGNLRHSIENGAHKLEIKCRAHGPVKMVAAEWCGRRIDPTSAVDELQSIVEILSIRRSTTHCYPLAVIVLALLIRQIRESRPSCEVWEALEGLHKLYQHETELSRPEFALTLGAMSMYEEGLDAERLLSRALAVAFERHPALWNLLLRLRRDLLQKSGQIEVARGIVPVLGAPVSDDDAYFSYALNQRLFGFRRLK